MQRRLTKEPDYDLNSVPFREFRDSEIGTDWGLGPEAVLFQRTHSSKHTGKSQVFDQTWRDEQVQPLPRSARRHLDGWIRAEELAKKKWEATLVVNNEPTGADLNGKMKMREVQMTYAELLRKSTFCRKVLSTCFMLERVDNFVVEHQWENFTCAVGPDGCWQPKLHILSPGMKPGGGLQHRPTLSKNGCYMVRLYFVGAWRSIWVNDMVPVDSEDTPLLPFGCPPSVTIPKSAKSLPNVSTPSVQLWPLLLCKALLKLGAPDMTFDDEYEEDEPMLHLNIMHCLTGNLCLKFVPNTSAELWDVMQKEVSIFSWDDEEDAAASNAMRSKSNKKIVKETSYPTYMRICVVTVDVKDTMAVPAYDIPGLTPALPHPLLVTMARDLPLIRPTPEPEIPLWKTYRWLDWAREHGLYDEYACPRKKWLKVFGLMKLSYAPHLMDVRSTESIANVFAKEQKTSKKALETRRSSKNLIPFLPGYCPELLDWVDFERLFNYVTSVNLVYLPSMMQAFAAGSSPAVKTFSGKSPQSQKPADLKAPTDAPLYLQVEGESTITLRLSLSTLHPKIIYNSGNLLRAYVKPGYLFLEKFEWLTDSSELPILAGYLETRGYDALMLVLPPGRHFFRIWVSCILTWHTWIMSKTNLTLCKRSDALALNSFECSWASEILSGIKLAFGPWSKVVPKSINLDLAREFYRSYIPDKDWDREAIGYPRSHLHWMFSRALEELLSKSLAPEDFHLVCQTLRRLFLNPDFGLPERKPPNKSLKNIIGQIVCDCYEESERDVPVIDNDQLETIIKTICDADYFDICNVSSEAQCHLKEEIECLVRKDEAAILIQSHWKRVKCQKLFSDTSPISNEALKIIADQVFGSTEGISSLMNKFFDMFPGARSCYTISSGLGGRYGLQQHNGISTMYAKDTWIPLFNGIFYCHSPVKINIDLECSLKRKSFVIFNNDTGTEVKKPMNSHMTYDFAPNQRGYTFHGHAWVATDTNTHEEDVTWELTLLCSIEGAFHVCDNATPNCQEFPLAQGNKFRLEEMFMPNRRNILATSRVHVFKACSLSLRISASWPELSLTAILRIVAPNPEEVARCTGRGELYWPHIQLESSNNTSKMNHGANIHEKPELNGSISTTKKTPVKKPGSSSSRRATSAKQVRRNATPPGPEPEEKIYEIEVITPKGWPLTSSQWLRVDEARDPVEVVPVRPVSARKTKQVGIDDMPFVANPPREGDASFELEVSMATGGGASVRRHIDRELAWLAEQKSWQEKDKTRQFRGSIIRDEFLKDQLVPIPEPEVESESTISEMFELNTEQSLSQQDKLKGNTKTSGHSPSWESDITLTESESVEEERYFTKPQHLLEEFIPLDFVPFCTMEETETVVLTPEADEEAKIDREARIEAARQRYEDLQEYNLEYVLGRQKKRNRLIEKLFVDANWKPKLAEALDARDEVAVEMINRTVSQQKSLKNKKA